MPLRWLPYSVVLGRHPRTSATMSIWRAEPLLGVTDPSPIRGPLQLARPRQAARSARARVRTAQGFPVSPTTSMTGLMKSTPPLHRWPHRKVTRVAVETVRIVNSIDSRK